MINREAIYQALFNLVKDLPGFVTVSRRARLVKDVAAEEQPALFLEEGPGETVQNQGQGLPLKHFLHVDLGFYARLPDDRDLAPGSILNPLIDAIEAALEPSVCLITGRPAWWKPPITRFKPGPNSSRNIRGDMKGRSVEA